VTDQAGQTPSSVSAPYESLDLQGRKLLVVEDEPLVRRYLKELLLSANAEVKACRNADEALTLFRQSPHAYSLIVTDHTMPGMSGTEMLRVMRKLNPEVPVVLFSGYADVVSELEREELNITDVLLKPLMGDELEAAIARALGAR
jgi:CheY-like chemotaxis protein